MKFHEESKTTSIVNLHCSAKHGQNKDLDISATKSSNSSHTALWKMPNALTPVHFDTPQHWGLLFFDTASKTVYFDDGLKLPHQEALSNCC